METLSNLESFIRSAEAGSFSAAARRLGLTPTAISRNVAMLERNLGVRLFHRTTRKLSLTEAGEQLMANMGSSLDVLQAALSQVGNVNAGPSGLLKISTPTAFGLNYLMPMLPAMRERYPNLRVEWHLENRQVDIVAEGFDVTVGGGIGRGEGLVAVPLAPAHLVAVASPGYVEAQGMPRHPAELAALDGIVIRSSNQGRVRQWTMRNAKNQETVAELRESLIVNDAVGVIQAARLGLGVALLVVPDALPGLQDGSLVRLLPGWWVDAGKVSLFYSTRNLMPAKSRAFIDFVKEEFERQHYDEKFYGSVP
ncbi:LysR family transcriptional regulator [Pseudoduganella sp. FT55W]|uniref:LysR family transcriptional regulator n=1 Tax=Duganella rivi TaxID=2666083 RepID=A0A7X4KA39_9BURK|nr:LysR family transcriptional regulator [Duganella rivi]MYM65710.1 LysR family transcriptional regulator [Duganella rivi]